MAEVQSEQPETITDIQNYLQSFNKEIGESGEQFYATIDTQKLEGIDDGTLQMLAEQAASGTGTGGAGAGEASGYQTVAIVPDGESGGYVLIVQQPQQQQPTQQQDHSSSNQQQQQPSQPSVSKAQTRQTSRLTRIKKEKSEPEKPNDISVYDFDEANQPQANDDEEPMDDGEPGDDDENQNDDEGDGDDDVKPNLSTPKTPKRVKKQSKKTGKLSTPIGPSSSSQHMCNYCSYTSNKRYLLSRHMKSHSEERPHKCGICERGFKVIHCFSL